MRILTVLAVLAAAPLAAQSFDGVYRPAGPAGANWNCQVVGIDGGAIAVRGNLIQAVESTCELSAPIEIRRMEAKLFNGRCDEEGISTAHRFFLSKTVNGLAILRGDGAAMLLERCP